MSSCVCVIFFSDIHVRCACSSKGEHLNQELYRYNYSFLIALVSNKKSEKVQQLLLGNRLYEMQEVELKRRFNENPHLKRGEGLSLAKKLNLKPTTIHKWFHRQRLKSKSKTYGVNRGN